MKHVERKKEVFIILNDPSNFEKAAHYLERRGYKLTILTSVTDAVDNMKAKKPDVVLLSWNLKNTDITRVFTVFAHTFNYLCIVFPEDPSPRTVAAMVRSRIPHTVFPPLSGPSFERRIESLHKKHLENLQALANAAAPARMKNVEAPGDGVTLVRADEVPVSSVWEKIGPEAGQDGMARHYAWRGTDDNQDFYYYNGPQCPRYDADDRQWLGFEGNIPIVKARAHQSAGALPLVTGHTPIPSPASPVSDPHSVKSIILKCARDSVEGWTHTFPGILARSPSEMCVAAIAICTERFSGYLLFLRPVLDDLVGKAYFDIFVEEMKSNGEQFFWVEEPFSIGMAPGDFKNWASSHHQETVSLEIEGREITVAFIAQESLPRMEIQENAGSQAFIGIPQKEWLVADTALPFDLFLHLPVNQKYILYLKRGSEIRRQVLGKFMKFHVIKIFLPSNQKKEFFSYCLENKLRESAATGVC